MTTRDDVRRSVGIVCSCSAADPLRATHEIAEMPSAIEQPAITTLRNEVGSLTLEEVLVSCEHVDEGLHSSMDEVTGRWGIRVHRIEIERIDPPGSIQQAMEKRMRAERARGGDERSAILIAGGEARSRILEAEAESRTAALIVPSDGLQGTGTAAAVGAAPASQGAPPRVRGMGDGTP